MADVARREAPLCSEQFGSGTARGCRAAADGTLQWEAWGKRWWGFSGAFTAKPGERDGDGGVAPGTASPPLSRLLAVFLPQGFPDSVSPDYLPYQLWDSVQIQLACWAASSLPGGWVANQPVLPNRSKMDCNAKQWRLFADILNDVAMFLEIVAPIFPLCFTVTVCISNLAKCIVGVAGGATRAALTMHQARRNNMADVSAKDGSQETLVGLAGLLVSLLMLPLVSDRPSLSLCCFFFLTALHIYANYRAVRALVIETLNEGRLWLVLKHFLQTQEVLGPTAANRMEPLWTGFWPSLFLSLGVPLHRLTSSVLELQQLVEGHREPYLLRWDQPRNQVQVVLSPMAGPETILRAATHGLLLGALRGDGALPEELDKLRNRVRAGPEKESWVIVKDTHHVLDKLFPKFLKGLQDAGWRTEKHQLEVDEWRATWLPCPEKKVL
ncbi:RUS family member 1 isoform X3 [Phacochoerus africanus]|uniref:RUS family member 1 isoform X3 n=1 Tax=Phacochoerus africanus TaxID=41426 RepID=UPI001FD992F6|nr:RUS family member 1 isoform X3 [Phacochoerus africanus]